MFRGYYQDKELIFKSVLKNAYSLHWYDNGIIKYPKEKDFQRTIKSIVRSKLNLEISSEDATRLSYLKGIEKRSVSKRTKEMDNLWFLLQDNDYLLGVLYEDKDMFPRVYATCGTIFGVEQLQPVETISSFLTISESKEEWKKNLRNAVLLVELIEKLDEEFAEPYHLCDVRLDIFGLSNDMNKIKVTDSSNVYPRSVLKKMMKSKKSCQKHEDCDLYDCRGHCNAETKTCSDHVANNNLQIVCEKIFLGWRLSTRILLPGLLVSPYTPSEMAAVLRQCANPENRDVGSSRGASNAEMRKRLYHILVEVEQVVTSEFIF